MLPSVASTSFLSCRLARSMARPTWMPLASTSRLRLAPSLPRSVGFLPVFSPPERSLGHGPVQRQPAPIQSPQLVVLLQPLRPEFLEDVRLDPFLKAAVRRTLGTDAGGLQGAPLAAGAEHEEDGIHGPPIGHARVVTTEGMRLAGRQERFEALPQRLGDAPAVIDHGGDRVGSARSGSSHGRSSLRCSWTAAVVGNPSLLG